MLNKLKLLEVVNNQKQWSIFIVAGILFLFFHFILDFNGLYGQDSHAYYQFSLKLKEMLQGSENELGFFFWPKLFPFLGAIIGLTGVPVLLGLQLISLFSFIGSLFYTNKLIQSYHKKSGILFLWVAAATQIYFMRGGFLVMSDMLATFFCIFAMYQYSRYIKEGVSKSAIIFYVAAILAFFTRYPTGVLLFIPALNLSYLLFIRSGMLKRLVIIIGAIGLICFLMIVNGNFLTSLNHLIGTWTPLNIISRTFLTPDGSTENFVPNGLYALGNFFHLGYLSFGIFLLPFYKKLKGANWVLALSIFIYLLFLAGHEMQNYRFLIIVHPFVLLLLFPAFETLKIWLKEKRILVVFLVGVLFFNLGFSWYSLSKLLKVHHIEVEIVNAIKKLSSDDLIYSFYVDQSFKSYAIENKVENFFYKDYYVFKKGALVIFNEPKFKNQWDGHRIMSNWERLKENYQLDTVNLHSDNWIIYRIK